MMCTLGHRLREARVRHGLAVNQIAQLTGVPPRILDDIEQDRLDLLPRGIFARGHVRAYARAVGVDPGAAVSAYMAQRFGDAGETLPIHRRAPIEPESHPGRTLLIEAAVLAFAVASVALFNRAGATPPESPATAVPPASLAIAPPSTAPDRAFVAAPPATLDTLGVVENAPPAATQIRLEIRPDGPCWISASADGTPVIRRLLQAGDRAVAAAQREVLLHVGDPGTFRYWINGVHGVTLGEPGKPVTVRITGENYHTFVDESAIPTPVVAVT